MYRVSRGNWECFFDALETLPCSMTPPLQNKTNLRLVCCKLLMQKHLSWKMSIHNFRQKQNPHHHPLTLSQKPATHYSSLFANNDKIIFSWKNLNFAKRGENTPTHCSSSTAVFANMNFVFRATKNRLWVLSRNGSGERRRRRTQNEKPVCKTSAKMLYTLFAFRSFFVISLIFLYCLR